MIKHLGLRIGAALATTLGVLLLLGCTEIRLNDYQAAMPKLEQTVAEAGGRAERIVKFDPYSASLDYPSNAFDDLYSRYRQTIQQIPPGLQMVPISDDPNYYIRQVAINMSREMIGDKYMQRIGESIVRRGWAVDQVGIPEYDKTLGSFSVPCVLVFAGKFNSENIISLEGIRSGILPFIIKYKRFSVRSTVAPTRGADQATVVPNAKPLMSSVEKLENLKAMKEKGLISDSEYTDMKKKILDAMQ